VPAAPDETRARVRLGPLLMNPSIQLSNVGVDTNLFNDPDYKDPKEDLALSLVPQAELWMRMGRTWLTGGVREDLIWYRDYVDERAVNGSYRAGWLVPLNRFSLVADGVWLQAKERPNYEIDVRTQRREWAGTTALEVRALSRTYFGARIERRAIRFDSDEVYRGENLQEQLDHDRTLVGVGVRYELTPLTSITSEISSYQDRFTLSPDRNADSMQVSAGVTFDPAALIKGSAQVGYQHFSPDDPRLPDYQGVTFAWSLTYEARDATRLGVEGIRDVEYSYSSVQPYYLLSGVTGTVTQRIHGPADVQGRAGYRALSYRNVAGTPAILDRKDYVTTLGAGLGFRVSRDVRMSFDIEHEERRSDLELRAYHGLRYGVSVSYGL
jgi:hypothetical protein